MAGALTACQSAATGGGKQAGNGNQEPIKIGAVFSASGGSSPLGKPEMDTVQMLVDKLNTAGGVKGRPIKLIAYDDKSDQNEAVLSIKKLMEQEKVAAVIGGTSSGNSLAMIPQAEKSKIPFISVAASKKIVQPVRQWVFKTAPSDDLVVRKVLEYLKAQNLTKVAWLNVDNAFGSSGYEEFQALAGQYGIEAVSKEVFEATVNDAKPMLTRVKKANPQAVIIWGTAQESAVVTKNVKELGIDVPVIESHGIATKKFVELSGDAANGVIFPAGKLLVVDQLPDQDPQKQLLADYKKGFEAKFGYEASTFGGHAWDAFQILIRAIQTAGDDPTKIRDTIERNTVGFAGTGGIFNLNANDHNGLTTQGLVMIEIRNGTWKIKP
nr:ABC transporter substrate-binding protein [Effusibacillus pohliae]